MNINGHDLTVCSLLSNTVIVFCCISVCTRTGSMLESGPILSFKLYVLELAQDKGITKSGRNINIGLRFKIVILVGLKHKKLFQE